MTLTTTRIISSKLLQCQLQSTSAAVRNSRRVVGRAVFGASSGSSNNLSAAATTSQRSFSSPSLLNPMEWWKNRQATKEAEHYETKIKNMADKTEWTIGDLHAELAEAMSSWVSKVPGLNATKEHQVAQELYTRVSAIQDVVGTTATVERFELLSKKEKLQMAVKAKCSLEELTTTLHQFESMALMHRVIRYRVQHNEPLPKTADAMQTLLQTIGPKLLSKRQKQQMQKMQQKRIKMKNIKKR